MSKKKIDITRQSRLRRDLTVLRVKQSPGKTELQVKILRINDMETNKKKEQDTAQKREEAHNRIKSTREN